MTGSVQNAAPATTFPVALSAAFARTRSRAVRVNEYRNGEVTRAGLVANDRNSWSLSRRLTSTELAELRSFYLARGGKLEAFYFYDPWETNPKFTLAPTGSTGRYVVRFACNWEEEIGFPRHNVSIELVEVA